MKGPEILITIKGKPNTGKTTIASLIKECLEGAEFQDVYIWDSPPSPDKSRFWDRFQKNQTRTVLIKVEVEK